MIKYNHLNKKYRSIDRRGTMDKIIITVVGKDKVGIIARVCTYLSEQNINILDITQTILSGFFNMMVIADMSGAKKEFSEIADDLGKIGDELGLRILAQREEIFTKMHRI